MHTLNQDVLSVIFSYLDLFIHSTVLCRVCSEWRRVSLQTFDTFRFNKAVDAAVVNNITHLLDCLTSKYLNLKVFSAHNTNVVDVDLIKQLANAEKFKYLEEIHLKSCLLTWNESDSAYLSLNKSQKHCQAAQDALSYLFMHMPPSLKVLDLSGIHNPLSKTTFVSYWRRNLNTKLEELNLSGCYTVTDEIVHHLSKCCPTLKKLNLGKCHRLTDASMESICKNLTSLKKLSMRNCLRLTNKSVIYIIESKLPLVSLNLSFCKQIDAPTLESLLPNTHLSRLSVSGTALISLTSRASYINNHLSDLTLTACHSFTECWQLSRFPQLRSLNISHCQSLTDESVKEWCDRNCHHSNLTTFNMSSCFKVRQDGLASILSSGYLTHIENLILSSSNITDQLLETLAYQATKYPQMLHSLKYLNISYPLDSSKLTDNGIRIICTFKGLEKLRVDGCSSLTPLSIEYLATLNKLKSLSLTECTGIHLNNNYPSIPPLMSVRELSLSQTLVNNELLDVWVSKLSNLKSLDLSYCRNIETTGVNRLLKSLSHSLIFIDLTSSYNVNTDNLVDYSSRLEIKAPYPWLDKTTGSFLS
jgi:hypothetical protein